MRSGLWLLLMLSGCPHPKVEPTTQPTTIKMSDTATTRPTKVLDDTILQGTWEVQIPGGPMGGAVVRWRFEQGTYTLSGYPALTGTGKYKVTRSDGVNLFLELSEQTGDWSQFNTLEVVADQGAQTLTLRGKGPYRKVAP